MKTRAGTEIRITGRQAAGSNAVVVEYRQASERVVAANAGDYIYPSDVRINDADILYVRAEGLPASGNRPRAWLFEYDLTQRQQTGRLPVDERVLPEECEVVKQPTCSPPTLYDPRRSI